MWAYQIHNLDKIYANGKNSYKSNNNINLHIKHGEIFALLGNNGAGKSTLIKQLANLITPTSGRILLFNQLLGDDPIYTASHIGYMPQEGRAFDDLTVREALYSTARLRGFTRSNSKEACSNMLESLKITSFENNIVSQLSGGQKRLVALGAAIITYPPVIILDEPTSNLDPEYRQIVWKLISDIATSTNPTTIIIVTHNLLAVEQVASQIGIMKNGCLIANGYVSDFIQQFNEKIYFDIIVESGEQLSFFNDFDLHYYSSTNFRVSALRSDMLPILKYLTDEIRVTYFTLNRSNLESVYHQIMESGINT